MAVAAAAVPHPAARPSAGKYIPSTRHSWNYCDQWDGCRFATDDGVQLELPQGGCELRFQAGCHACSLAQSAAGTPQTLLVRSLSEDLPPATDCRNSSSLCVQAPTGGGGLQGGEQAACIRMNRVRHAACSAANVHGVIPCPALLLQSVAYPAALIAKGPDVPFMSGGPIMTSGPQVQLSSAAAVPCSLEHSLLPTICHAAPCCVLLINPSQPLHTVVAGAWVHTASRARPVFIRTLQLLRLPQVCGLRLAWCLCRRRVLWAQQCPPREAWCIHTSLPVPPAGRKSKSACCRCRQTRQRRTATRITSARVSS